MRETITGLILTYNEAPNIRRTLEKLTWLNRILIVDNFSTDETLRIAQDFPQVTVTQHRNEQHAKQWNFGLNLCQSDWVLALDADYVLSEGLISELQNLEPEPGVTAYFTRFAYCVNGRPLRGSLYPPREILFRRDCCRYYQDGHTQALQVSEGRTGWLENIVLHDDRKSLTHWLAQQDRNAFLEIDKLTRSPANELSIQDRIRRHIFFAPVIVFFYTLFARKLILDGWEGWYYTFQRVLVELLISLRLFEARRATPPPDKRRLDATQSSSSSTV